MNTIKLVNTIKQEKKQGPAYPDTEFETEQKEFESKDQKPLVPCCAVLGHVNVGKTKLLDRMRGTVTSEASGITQQIGTTLYSKQRLQELMGHKLASKFTGDSMLMIDTPGHDCFDSIRYVAMTVADVCIVMIDILHDISTQRQLLSIIQMLDKLKKPFIICCNKIDMIYGWKECQDTDDMNLRSVFQRMGHETRDRFNGLINRLKTSLYQHDIQSEPYYQNKYPDTITNIVPISAKTGEGIPDLIMLITMMAERKYLDNKLTGTDVSYGYILDFQKSKVHGDYMVALHRQSNVRTGDTVRIQNSQYRVKHLLKNSVNHEIKSSHRFERTDEINSSCGYGVILEPINSSVINGIIPSSMYLVMNDSVDLKSNEEHSVMLSDDSIYGSIKRKVTKGPGIQIVAPSLVMAGGLVQMLETEHPDIKIERIKAGIITKQDMMISGKWYCHKPESDDDKTDYRKHAVILSYDPNHEEVSKQTLSMANQYNVKIIHSDTIYRLVADFSEYLIEMERSHCQANVLYGGEVRIIPRYIFRKSKPIVVGVSVIDGTIRKGKTVFMDRSLYNEIGTIESLKRNDQDTEFALPGEDVCIKVSTKLSLEKDIMIDNPIYFQR